VLTAEYAAACCLAALLVAAWAQGAGRCALLLATASRDRQIRRSREGGATNDREGRGRGGIQSKRRVKLAVEPSASLLRAIGRPARVRALTLLAAGLPSCKQPWALSSSAVGASIWTRGCEYIKKLYTIKYFVFRPGCGRIQ